MIVLAAKNIVRIIHNNGCPNSGELPVGPGVVLLQFGGGSADLDLTVEIIPGDDHPIVGNVSVALSLVPICVHIPRSRNLQILTRMFSRVFLSPVGLLSDVLLYFFQLWPD